MKTVIEHGGLHAASRPPQTLPHSVLIEMLYAFDVWMKSGISLTARSIYKHIKRSYPDEEHLVPRFRKFLRLHDDHSIEIQARYEEAAQRRQQERRERLKAMGSREDQIEAWNQMLEALEREENESSDIGRYRDLSLNGAA